MEKSKTQICVIGGAIMDLMAFTEYDIKISDSVPGNIEEAPGGVGRNIAENLARLNLNTCLITAFGNDSFSEKLIADAKKSGIDLTHSLRVTGEKSATFIALMDKTNDMHAGIAALDIFQNLDVAFLQSRQEVLQKASIVIADTNIPEKSLYWLAEQSNIRRLFLDLVSMKLTKKVKKIYNKFHTIKANRFEAEYLTGISLKSKKEFKFAAEKMIESGLKRIFITAGKQGVYFADHQSRGWLNAICVNIKNTTGAGDAFMSGIIYGSINNLPIEACGKLGIAAAGIALGSTKAVNVKMNEALLLKYKRRNID